MTKSTATTRGIPETRSYVDCTGQKRTFRINLTGFPDQSAFWVEAVELDPPVTPGYRFQSALAHSHFAAFAELNPRIRKALSKRHIVMSGDGGLSMISDDLEGRIAHDGVVVDGHKISFDEFQTLLTTHEGFGFRLVIED